ncbi:glycosyltransferase family 4 protein [Metabacillus fastidiosus]|uniref:glycosyltransferase family 4 protein n=1 Tax=Metabacillus fastidiosus TaxID=1458 RepID=UPI002DBB870D|nr:glycosyltransferase family 4 protein [Metabacillus fastidiosus]MEC2077074.1 glycosyltransferase family 4 protein [Metabacillus fastidiosus]
MNILHIPYGPAMIDLCLALRLRGVNAASCHFYSNRYQFQPDYCLNLQNSPISLREEKIKKFLEEAIKKYDIFHFHFGETFLPDKSDLEIIKNAGKKMVVHHHGSEVRMLSVAQKLNKYVRVKPEWTEEKIHNNLLKLSSYIDHAFVQDYELEYYIKDYYKNIHVIPHTIDVRKFRPNFPKEKNAPLIVHAPTSRDLKGTEHIIDAVNSLKREGIPLYFQLIEGKTNSQARELLSRADIVIDQIRIGAYGYVSTEAMVLGKPVICYIREDLVNKYPSELPIINANPDNLTSILKNLVSQPENWRKLGVLGRRYVKQYHSTHKIAEDYIKLYKSL